MCVIPKTCLSGYILGEEQNHRESVKYIFVLQYFMVYYICKMGIYTNRSLIYTKSKRKKAGIQDLLEKTSKAAGKLGKSFTPN